MHGIEIRTAGPDDVTAAADILTLAFAGDPPTRYWWPAASDFMHWWPRLIQAVGASSFAQETATVALDADGVICGAALWLPPGVELDWAAMDALDMPGDDEDEEISNELGQAMAVNHPHEPHWYLWLIGVDPRLRGKGVGSALLTHTLALCDERGETAYLESSILGNVPLYERHGFEVTGMVRVRDIPPLTPMVRMPR